MTCDTRESVDIHLMKDCVLDVLETLQEREKLAVQKRWLEDATWKEVGRVIGVSIERARQIGCKALRKLQHPHRRDILEAAYFGSTVDHIRDKRDRLKKLEEYARRERARIERERRPPAMLSLNFFEDGTPYIAVPTHRWFDAKAEDYAKWLTYLLLNPARKKSIEMQRLAYIAINKVSY